MILCITKQWIRFHRGGNWQVSAKARHELGLGAKCQPRRFIRNEMVWLWVGCAKDSNLLVSPREPHHMLMGTPCLPVMFWAELRPFRDHRLAFVTACAENCWLANQTEEHDTTFIRYSTEQILYCSKSQILLFGML
jgi:hypothetical protein